MRIIKATLEHLDLLAPLFVKYREFYGQLPYPDSSARFWKNAWSAVNRSFTSPWRTMTTTS